MADATPLTPAQRQALRAQLSADDLVQIDAATAILNRAEVQTAVADMTTIASALGSTSTVGQQISNLVNMLVQTPKTLTDQRARLAAFVPASEGGAAPG